LQQKRIHHETPALRLGTNNTTNPWPLGLTYELKMSKQMINLDGCSKKESIMKPQPLGWGQTTQQIHGL
jgi:hypothetical protein